MSLYTEWKDLTDNQTDATFEDFWKRYCDAEIKLYAEILKDPAQPMEGRFGDLREKYDVEPVLFMGFLDGINSSLTEEITDIEETTEDTALRLLVEPEKLYYNMHAADASHLYELEGWEQVLPEEDRIRIAREYKRSKTIIKEEKIGRNALCPCGSGKKYKHCCGK
jgi:hypothetical protein